MHTPTLNTHKHKHMHQHETQHEIDSLYSLQTFNRLDNKKTPISSKILTHLFLFVPLFVCMLLAQEN